MAKRSRINPRKSPRQARSKDTVSLLVETAARILARDGYQKANVNQIAAVAGVSVGSLYQYFPSKDALVMAVMRRHAERMMDIIRQDIADLALLPMPDAVRGIVRRALDAYGLEPALRRVMSAEEPKFGALARSQEFDELLRQLLKAYLDFHHASIRPSNRELAIRILMAAVEGIGAELLVEDASLPQSDELVDEVSLLVLRYLEK